MVAGDAIQFKIFYPELRTLIAAEYFHRTLLKERFQRQYRAQIDKWLETINGKSLHELIMLTEL